MFDIIVLLHIVIALCLIGLVMLQQGKGADMGAAFGSGSSNTVFGSQGPASFLMKLTAFLMVLFFVTSLVLGRLSSSSNPNQSALSGLTGAAASHSQQMAAQHQTAQKNTQKK